MIPATTARVLCLPLIAVAALLLVGGVASAEPTWLDRAELSDAPAVIFQPQVAGNLDGDAVAVWQESEGGVATVRAASRMAGSDNPWNLAGTPISDPVNGGGEFPQVGIDGAGRGIAVWDDDTEEGLVIRAAHQTDLGTWEKDEALSGEDGGIPDLAVNEAGDAVAAWQARDGVDVVIRAAVRPAGGAWQVIGARVSDSRFAEPPRVAIGTDGAAVVTWMGGDGEGIWAIGAARCSVATATCEPAETVAAPASEPQYPKVATNASGDAVVVWNELVDSHSVVRAARSVAGEPFAVAEEPLSPSEYDTWAPEVGLTADGRAFVAWLEFREDSEMVRGADGDVDGSWAPSYLVSGNDLAGAVADGDDDTAIALDVNDSGAATVAWKIYAAGDYLIRTASRGADGAWRSPETVSSEAGLNDGAAVGVDAEGNAVTVWHGYESAAESDDPSVTQAAGYDAAGPRLNDLSVPGSGDVEQQLDFSVNPFDVWSAIASVEWDFGDGTMGSGANVTHSYAAAGTYQATVVATDAVGNSSRATRQVVIADAGEPCAGAGCDEPCAGDDCGGHPCAGGACEGGGDPGDGEPPPADVAASPSLDDAGSADPICESLLASPGVSVTHWLEVAKGSFARLKVAPGGYVIKPGASGRFLLQSQRRRGRDAARPADVSFALDGEDVGRDGVAPYSVEVGAERLTRGEHRLAAMVTAGGRDRTLALTFWVANCEIPAFSASMISKVPDSPTDLELRVQSGRAEGAAIESARFTISRRLRVKRARIGARAGVLQLLDTSGVISRQRLRVVKRGRRHVEMRGREGVKARLQGRRLELTGIEAYGATGVRLLLTGRRSGMLVNPKRCLRHRYGVELKTIDGQTTSLKRTLKMCKGRAAGQR